MKNHHENVTFDISTVDIYRNVFLSALDYVAFSLAVSGTYIDANPGFERLTGYAREEVIGHTSIELGIWPDKSARDIFLQELRSRVRLDAYPARLRTRHNELRDMEIYAHLFRINHEEVILTIIRDITGLKRDEEELQHYRTHLEQLVEHSTRELQSTNLELRETNRKLEEAHNQLLQTEKMASIGQLAAGVAHEINNPISFVNSNLSSLEAYLKDLFRILGQYEGLDDLLAAHCPEQHATIQSLKEELELDYLKTDIVSLLDESKDGLLRVKKIVQDLKDFSHVGKAEWQVADLHEGLESTLNIVNNEIKYKAKIHREYGEIPLIECLPLELNQVFMNMLVNAAHSISGNGDITIRTSAQDEQVIVEFQDNGCGIDPKNLKRIFDPFFTTKPIGKGTGLGLSLSYSIIQKHQGKIEVESTPGVGTCFKIRLPVKQKLHEETGQAAPPDAIG